MVPSTNTLLHSIFKIPPNPKKKIAEKNLIGKAIKEVPLDAVVQESSKAFKAKFPIIDNIGANLNIAKRLEQENPEEALKIYMTLADHGNPEAMQGFELMLRKVCGKKNPANQAILEQEKNWSYNELVDCLTWETGEALQNPWIRIQLNKTLTCEQISEASYEGVKALRLLEVQRFLEQKENQKYIGNVIGFSQEAAEALSNAWVRERLTNGTLTFQQLTDITRMGSRALCNPTIQDFLGQGENWKYIGLVSGFSSYAAIALNNDWVRARIIDKTLTFEQLADITYEECNKLCDAKTQRDIEA